MNNSQPSFPVTQAIGGQNSVIGVVIGYLDAQGNFQAVNTTTGLPTSGGGGGGGGAVTMASGAVASGAFSSGSVASGAFAAGALASGSVASGAYAAGAIADGADVTQGAKADAANTDSTSAWSVVALLKGMWTKLNGGVPLLDAGGTNKATVKAAATAPVAASDTALVVTPLINGLGQGTATLAGSTTLAAGMSVLGMAAPTNDLFGVNMAAASGTSSVINPTSGQSAIFSINLSGYSAGSSTGFDAKLQYSPDGQSNWYDIWHFERLTANGAATTPPLPLGSMLRRITWANATAAATSATVTLISNRTSVSSAAVFQYFDRTAAVLAGTPLNSATPAYLVAGCKNVTVTISTTSITTTGAAYQLQTSADGANWTNIGSASATVTANSTIDLNTTVNTKRFVRVIVSTAASGAQVGSLIAITATA